LAFSYWIDNLGFITEGKLAAIFIKPSLGVSNWPVIYFINYTPTSSLAPFITAPSDDIQSLMRLLGIYIKAIYKSPWRRRNEIYSYTPASVHKAL
jgi:hypothetical protein